ncbi:sigma-54 dependent transcriptional regulator [bacterium]|nr:sigma-54 dependent transcriptional regulator [bacterium]
MRILLVDDDPHGRELLADYLTDQLYHDVTQCGNGIEALATFKAQPFPLVISDIRMPGMDGLELLQHLKSLPLGDKTDLLFITGHGDMSTAVQALRGGACDYLLKPVNLEELELIVSRIADNRAMREENRELTTRFREKVDEATRETRDRLADLQKAFAQVVGVGKVGVFSDKMQEIVALAERFHEDRSVPVLIEGETGTGKEVVARLVHYGHAAVSPEPFIPINCSAISPTLFESELFGYEGGAFSGARKTGQPGKFELASGGTLFLDEIGDMPLDLQPKLLRALQEREFFRVGGIKRIAVSVRIVCATNQDLAGQVREGKFRRDLYYRLNTGRIRIPPLRERQDEALQLARMFLEQFAAQRKKAFHAFSPQAERILLDYPWPGNVRELQNAIERVTLLHDATEVSPEHLAFLATEERFDLPAPDGGADPAEGLLVRFPAGGLDLRQVEERVIRRVLDMFEGNKSRAAAYLNVNRNTLHNRLK